MNEEQLGSWLFENGGPVIRYRIATELRPRTQSMDIRQLTHDLTGSPLVLKWLRNLVPPRLLWKHSLYTPRVFESGIMEIHGNKPAVLENSLARLTDFGLKQGMPELDRRTLPYRKWLEERRGQLTENVYDLFSMGLTASYMACAGYSEPSIGANIRKRLNMVYDFARRGDYDIHIKGKSLRNKPLIKLELTPGGHCLLPLIYDVVGWSAYLPKNGTKEERAKADTIMEYILDDAYQKLP